MKTVVETDLLRTLPSLAFTALLSAGGVIVLAVTHSLVSPTVSPPPQAVAKVNPKPAAARALDPPRVTVANKDVLLPKKALAEPKPAPEIVSLPKRPAEKSLTAARADYQREKTQFLQAVSADLAKREVAAQDAGDAELLKQVKVVREDYAKGMIPKDAPGKDLLELISAREKVTTILQCELKVAEEKSDAAQVATLEKELADFMFQESADIGDINWRFPDCTFRLINVATGMALAAHDEGNGAAVVQMPENPTDPLQQWFVKYKGQWFERVRLRKNGRNLNVPAHDRAAGREIIMWQEEDKSNGYWELQYRGAYYHVRSLFSGQLLSVPNASKAAGQQLCQWPHHDDPQDQRWKLIRVLPKMDAD